MWILFADTGIAHFLNLVNEGMYLDIKFEWRFEYY